MSIHTFTLAPGKAIAPDKLVAEIQRNGHGKPNRFDLRIEAPDKLVIEFTTEEDDGAITSLVDTHDGQAVPWTKGPEEWEYGPNSTLIRYTVYADAARLFKFYEETYTYSVGGTQLLSEVHTTYSPDGSVSESATFTAVEDRSGATVIKRKEQS